MAGFLKEQHSKALQAATVLLNNRHQAWLQNTMSARQMDPGFAPNIFRNPCKNRLLSKQHRAWLVQAKASTKRS